MNEALEMIKSFLEDDGEDAVSFSIALENYLCDSYDVIAKENPEVADALCEELPEICASFETGADVNEFKKKIRTEYRKALALV